ncbi:MAG: sugar ABC transporter substrate-binding protein [Erysipelotrichia bacterium]|nr:sugar ABC transporter substrate-binding protein [Erysipelotrichia bacterium]NCC54032.1 sugar ABC transporter substrate-binding protein [Erysipelotrichia bacterium]
MIEGGSMKKIGIFILLLLLGCTSEHSIQNKDTYILFATPLKENEMWLQSKKGFQDACRLYKFKCDWIGPNVMNTEYMNDVIETGIMQNVDAMITQGVVNEQLIEEAYNKKIPVVLVDSDLLSSKRLMYIGKDFKRQAKLLLEDIEKKKKKEKLIVAVQVGEQSFQKAKDQIETLKEMLATHEGGYEIISVSESKTDIVKAKKEWTEVLEKYPDVNVAFNFTTETGIACAEVVKEKGLKEHMLIYGVNDTKEMLALVRNQMIDGSIVTSFYDYGFKSVEVLMHYLQDRQALENTKLSLDVMLINQENINSYEK